MQLLTFLGTGNYLSTCYTWEDKKCETSFVTEAIAEFFQPELIKIFVTKEAKEKNWNNLQATIGDRFPLESVLIPSGKIEEEIWQIFDCVVDSVPANTQVIFDITHAFRSLPLIVLLASVFLQKARNVEIKGVYYGAFEANREQAPIFDLTSAITLLEWLTATDKFIETGSAKQLSNLLLNIQRDFYQQRTSQRAQLRPHNLNKLARTIDNISQDIEFIRVRQLLQETAKLERISAETLREEIGVFAKPFKLLLDKIEADYSQFAIEDLQKSEPKLIVKKHFLLIQWYVEKGLETQAILLSREWIVTSLAILENTNYLDQNERSAIEEQLGQMLDQMRREKIYDQPITKHVREAKTLADVWSKLTKYRNDIAHCEMRIEPLSADSLHQYAQQLPSILKTIFPVFST